ncbi:hypothetical protein AB6N23_01865 [Cellulomonas sp. 179-A 9B4 NHS]|uniref:hypothetical protein n=1 Tax=Cellulomonas sp. 179-A 9B4 NHS TaxID=3142379 RepID=UPI00399F1AE0
MSAVELSTDELLYRMLWSRREATRLLRQLGGPQYFAGRAHLGATIAALIASHDHALPDAPMQGPERVLSVFERAGVIARDVRENPDRYRDAAAGMRAHHSGGIDLTLLRHAAAARLELPRIATVGDVGTPAGDNY